MAILRKPFLTLHFFLCTILNLVLAGFLISSCGGGGGSTGTPFPSKALSWEAPVSYADSTPLNPIADLESFEIYVKGNGTFSDQDLASATIAAYDSGIRQVATSFNISDLGPYFSKGVVYHFSVRAIAKNGLKSGFSSSVTFSF